jgi:glycosyl transferase family 4
LKRVVIIGADFSPSSLPPATRIRFFAKHLPEFGWEPIILTTQPEYYESATDPENERLLPNSLEVIRTRALPASLTRKLGIGDLGMRTVWHHWRALSRLQREKKIDLIFIPVPPNVPMVLGRLANMRFGIPYVVDYIDPWVTEYYWSLPRKQRPPKWLLSYALSRCLEPFALKNVAHITGVSKGTTDSVLERYPWLKPDDATEIPYGAEADDFAYVRKQPRKNPIFDRADGLFHMSYVGACIPGMHATVRALFQAVRAGLDRMPEKFGRLRLHFVGTSYAPNGSAPKNVLALAREEGIEGHVDEQPKRIPYLDSLQVMIDSHGLFLVGSEEPHYTASKVFPYILAGRPLLAVFHEESSVIRILRDTGAGTPITFTSKESPARKIEEILGQLENIFCEKDSNQFCAPAVEKYSTFAMAGRLADCLVRASSVIGQR